MKLKRHSSKRVPLARKYNLQKKVKAHNHKLKKQATGLKKSGVLANKKNGAKLSSISIPNAWPEKREMLAEFARKKEEAIQEKMDMRKRKKAGIPEPVFAVDKPVSSYEQILAASAERARQFELKNSGGAALEESFRRDSDSPEIAQTRKKFYEDLVKVTNLADVVLVVLDARDPEACRSEKLETDIRANGKRLVFLLNKIDLVPAEAVEAWLAFYRKIAPTIAFKACTSGAGKAARKAPLTMGPIKGNEEIYQASSANYGGEKLVLLLKQYSRNGLGTGSLTVGVVGFPNVGKSSIINTLTGLRRGTGSSNSSHVKTGNTAGVTSQLQEIQLDNKITLIDSAGVVFPSGIANSDASLILRRAINVDSLRDPIGTVGRLLNHRGVTVESLCQILRVTPFKTAQDLITNVAQAHGKVKRGGGADMEAAARFLLNRVSDGKSHFYTMPPTNQGLPGGFAFVVNEFKPEMDLNLGLDDAQME